MATDQVYNKTEVDTLFDDLSGTYAPISEPIAVAETARAEAAEALLAPLASPALTGSPTAPTKTALDNSTKLATTAYADSAVAVEATARSNADALKAPIASPALTGSPTAPTQSAGDNSTKLATTAYADTAAGARAPNLTRVARTGNFTAALGDIEALDTTSGTFVGTIPAASAGKGRISFKWVAGSVAPTLALTGSDHINTSSGTVPTFSVANQGYQLESDGTSIWTVTADDIPLSQLDLRYAAINTGAAPDQLTGSPPLAAWYKADAITGLSDGTAVTTWSDSSGAGRDVTQGTSGKRPIYKSAVRALGGMPGVLFDGSDDTLGNTAFGLTLTTRTIFAVATISANLAGRYIVDARSSGASGFTDFYFDGTLGPSLRGGSGNVAQVNDSQRRTAIWVGVADGTNITLYVNGVAEAFTAESSASVTLANFYLGSNFDGASSYWPGHIAEFGLYTTALSVAQVNQLMRFLSRKYSIPGAVAA